MPKGKKKDPTQLTAAEERAVQEYMLNGGNQSAAYRKGFPQSLRWKNETVWSRASELFKQSKVRARVKQLRELSANEAVVTERKLLTEAAHLAFADIRQLHDDKGNFLPMSEWPHGAAAAVQAIEYEQIMVADADGNYSGDFINSVKKVTLAPKVVAMDKLFKHLGLFEKDNMQKGSFQTTGWESIPPEVRNIFVERLRAIAGTGQSGSELAGSADAVPSGTTTH